MGMCLYGILFKYSCNFSFSFIFIQFLRSLLESKKCIDTDIKNILVTSDIENEVYTVTIEIINKSSKPIVISQISILIDDVMLKANYAKEKICFVNDSVYLSDSLPINLSGMQAHRGNYRFCDKNNSCISLENAYFKIEFTTNRGVISKKVNYLKSYSNTMPEVYA